MHITCDNSNESNNNSQDNNLNNFLQNYEKKLVESALCKRNREIAEKMKKGNYPPKEILKMTGVDITKDF